MTADDTATLYIRNVPQTAVEALKQAAAVRQWTMADYLAALVEFHAAARALADGGDQRLQTELMVHGLETIHA